jgi:hypothetical protein
LNAGGMHADLPTRCRMPFAKPPANPAG